MLEFVKKNVSVTRNQIREGTGLSSWYCYKGRGIDKLVDMGLLETNYAFSEKANKEVMFFMLSKKKSLMGLPIFPVGVPVDTSVKGYITDVLTSKTVKPTVKPDSDICDIGNSSGILVLRYLLYAGEFGHTVMPPYIPAVKQKYQKTTYDNRYYGRYFGNEFGEIKNPEDKEEIDPLDKDETFGG